MNIGWGISLIIISILLIIIALVYLFLQKKEILRREFKKNVSDFNNLNIERLKMRLDQVRDDLVFNEKPNFDEVFDAHTLYTDLNMNSIPEINNLEIEIFEKINKKSIFATNKFISKKIFKYKNLIHKYKLKFLLLQFKVNEMHIDTELIDEILEKIKLKFGESMHILMEDEEALKGFSKSFYLTEKDEINTFLQNLGIDTEKYTPKENNDKIILLIDRIKDFIFDLKFIRKFSHEENLVEDQINKIIEVGEKNSKILSSMLSSINKNIVLIRTKLREAKDSINHRKLEFSKSILKAIIMKVHQLYTLINFEIDSSKLINLYEKEFNDLAKTFKSKWEFLIEETRKRKFQDESIRIEMLKQAAAKFATFANYYLNIKREGYSINRPQKIMNITTKMLEEYTDYYAVIEPTIIDVVNIIKNSNAINKQLAKINFLLLETENMINSFSYDLQSKYSAKISNFQNMINVYIKKNKTHEIILIKNDDKNLVNKLLLNVENFYTEITNIFYIFKYVEKMIISLNKYRERNYKIDEMMKEIENSFYQGDLALCLRLGLKICQLNKIYE